MTLTLAEKVYGLLALEGFQDPQTFMGPKAPKGEYFSELEQDLANWGLTFGMAYGIARGEDPYEDAQRVGERSLQAATEAYKRFCGPEGFDWRSLYWKDRDERPVRDEDTGPER